MSRVGRGTFGGEIEHDVEKQKCKGTSMTCIDTAIGMRVKMPLEIRLVSAYAAEQSLSAEPTMCSIPSLDAD